MNTIPINERIKESRSVLGLTQVKFAERIAISSSYLADIENNKKTASERIIRLLSAEFKINDQWLRTGKGTMFLDEIDSQTAKLLSLFKSLNPSYKICALTQLAELSALQERNRA